AMKRLLEQDPKLDDVTPEDRRGLKTIRKEAGWYGDNNYEVDEYASLLALIWHPNGFDARDRDPPVELFAYPAELVVSETANGYSFALSHSASQPTVFIEEETPTRWRVIEVPQKLVELHATLGKDGLIVPIDMHERVVALLRADNPALPIRSELADLEIAAVEGAVKPVLQIRRAEEGLSIEIVVRPLGPDGPAYMPGHGGRSVLAMANGVRHRVNRDLTAEVAAAEQLIAACPSLRDWRAGHHEWRIGELEASLAFI